MMTVDSFVGVDGCKAGWLAVALNADGARSHHVEAHIDAVAQAHPRALILDAYVRSRGHGGVEIREMHPEVCFWGLNGARPLQHRKASREGYRERIRLLARHVPDVADFVDQVLREHRRSVSSRDDVVDALAGPVTGLLARDRLQTLPAQPEHDAFGLPMEIVYAVAERVLGAEDEPAAAAK